MTILAAATVLGLASSCQMAAFGEVLIAPHLIQAQAEQESGFDTDAVHHNPNGTDDVGLMQINTGNFPWLRITRDTARRPCVSIVAAVSVSLSVYNTGSRTRGIANGYAQRVLARLRSGATPVPPQQVPPVHHWGGLRDLLHPSDVPAARSLINPEPPEAHP
jgi:hypothetical protein